MEPTDAHPEPSEVQRARTAVLLGVSLGLLLAALSRARARRAS